MKEFFAESDCDIMSYQQCLSTHPQSVPIRDCISLARANQLIRERSKVVYAHSEEEQRRLDYYEWKEYPNFLGAERRALLLNIEPIAQPDSMEKFVREFSQHAEKFLYLDEWARRAKALLERKDSE